MLFFVSFYWSNNQKNNYHRVKIIKQHNSFIIYQHIRMISEGSCDTEDWSNDAENSVLRHRNKLYFKIYSHRKPIFNTSQ